jgi:HTH-type transcriptional regulator/antitoxin HigA
MQRRGLSRADLQRILASGSGRVFEFLNRRRPLSVEMMRRLHAVLGIPADSLLRPTARRRAASAGREKPRKRNKSREGRPAKRRAA